MRKLVGEIRMEKRISHRHKGCPDKLFIHYKEEIMLRVELVIRRHASEMTKAQM